MSFNRQLAHSAQSGGPGFHYLFGGSENKAGVEAAARAQEEDEPTLEILSENGVDSEETDRELDTEDDINCVDSEAVGKEGFIVG